MRVSEGSGPFSALTTKLNVGPSQPSCGRLSGPQPNATRPTNPNTTNQPARVKARRAYSGARRWPVRTILFAKLHDLLATSALVGAAGSSALADVPCEVSPHGVT